MSYGRIIRVAGVTFDGRQKLIKGIKSGERVRLVQEPDNPYDPYAIKVVISNMHVGYIPKERARKISETWDLFKYFARLEAVVEGDDHPDHKRSWGLRIRVAKMRRRKP